MPVSSYVKLPCCISVLGRACEKYIYICSRLPLYALFSMSRNKHVLVVGIQIKKRKEEKKSHNIIVSPRLGSIRYI